MTATLPTQLLLPIPTQRPAPAQETAPPADPGLYTASCGCVGVLLAEHQGEHPYADVRLTLSCLEHRSHVSAGVIVHFALSRPRKETHR